MLFPQPSSHLYTDYVPRIEEFLNDRGRLGIKLLDFYEGDVLSSFIAIEEHYEGEFQDQMEFSREHFHQNRPEETFAKRGGDGINYKQYQIALFGDDYFGFYIKGRYHVFSSN